MLEDFYMEYLIKKKTDGRQKALIAAIFAGAAAVSVLLFFAIMMAAFAFAGTPITSFIFSIGLVLIAFVWYGAYLLYSMQNIEFEYILTNSELDIDKIMSKKGRKSVVSFDFKEVIICAAIDDNLHNADYKNITPDKLYNTVGNSDYGDVYFADFQDESGRVRALFQPTYQMISAARKFNPRNIFVKE